MAFSASGNGLSFPVRSWKAVTPSDTVNLPAGCVGLYIGGAGNIAAVGIDDVVATFTAIPVGGFLPIGPKRINATNTTATLILALYTTR